MTRASAASRSSSGAVTPKEQPHETLDVHGGAGEGHRRVQGQRQRARAQGGVQDFRAVPPRGVHEQLPRPHGPGLGQALHESGQGVVGDGQQHQVGALEDVRGGDERNVREHQLGTPPGGVGDPGDGHRAVPGELEDAASAGPTR